MIWKAVERGDAGAHIAQQSQSHLEDVGKVAECLPVVESVVGRIRLSQFGEFAVIPGEGAAGDNRAADAGAVAADEFGERVNDNVRTMLQRSEKVRGGDGIIDDKRDAGSMGNSGYRLEIINIVFRIADRLDVDQAGIFIDCLPDVFRIGGSRRI